MSHYTSIAIIYNPRSSGQSIQQAQKLKQRLERNIRQTVHLVPTKRRGHAETLAYDLARASTRPLIICASGDGGYHEVVNGAYRAQLKGAHPTTGLLPAGNANDHFRSLHQSDMVRAIRLHTHRRVDLIRFSYTDAQGMEQVRYAHSYIGLGFTSQAGRLLNANKQRLNKLIETWLVGKILLLHLKPVKLRVDGVIYSFDSLIFSNVRKMSKILIIARSANVADGMFEIAAWQNEHRLKLIARLLVARTWGLQGKVKSKQYRFETTAKTHVQLDGEIITLPMDAAVTVSVDHRVLRCIV